MTTQLPKSQHVYVSAKNEPLHLYTLEQLIAYGESRFEEGLALEAKQLAPTLMSRPVICETESVTAN